jgi:flavorubredoxin
MLKPREIVKDVSWMGSVDWDRRLFDALIPLPEGTSYNSYLVRGSEKTALIDTVDPDKSSDLLDCLGTVETLDYVVANHAEQDHAGEIGTVLARYPDAVLLCTPKCEQLLIDELHIAPERVQTVADGDTVSLGNKTLEFLHLPWVHWPETMVTYLQEDKILFSCDLFGSHFASSDLFVTDERRAYEPSKRYYAEIMMPFRKLIQRHLARLDEYDIAFICPSHGPLHNNPDFIVNAYKDWASDTPKNVVVIPWVSMHNSTRQMVDHLTAALAARGVSVERFDLTTADLGALAMALVDAATIVVGTPTVLTGAHPKVVYATYLAAALRPKARFGSVIGSHGWASRAVDQIAELVKPLKLDIIAPVFIKGAPRADDLAALDALAETIVAKHKEAGLL